MVKNTNCKNHTGAATRLLPLLACLASFCTVGVHASGENWTLAEEKDGVTVYTREVEDSPFLEVKGTVSLNTGVDRVTELMGDGNGCAEWRKTCKSSKVIEERSEAERVVYLVLDLPWPAADRDLVMRSMTEVDSDAQTATVLLVSDSTLHPPQDYVRAESEGMFVIKAIDDSKVEFTYIMHTDLGGNLPAGAVNSQLTDATLDELVRLRKLAES